MIVYCVHAAVTDSDEPSLHYVVWWQVTGCVMYQKDQLPLITLSSWPSHSVQICNCHIQDRA